MATQTITRNMLTDLLRQDHRKMTELFDEIENAEGSRRERLTKEALRLIQTHDVIERTLLYPAATKEGLRRQVVLDCEEAHHVARLLMAELKVLPYSDRYFAKFATLADGIREHVYEEENVLFPAIERSGIDNLSLGREMVELRQRVEARGFFGKASFGRGKLVGAAVAAGVVYAAYKAFSSKD